MRITACELPHEPAVLAAAWEGLCQHARFEQSELVLLPEFAMVEPVWEEEDVDEARWAAAVSQGEAWLGRLPELGAAHVVGTRPVSIEGRRLNQGYAWSAAAGLRPLRSKYYLPDEPGCRETRWFERGDAAFPAFHAGALRFGLSICTELWALETHGAYARREVDVILSPRATGAATRAKWLSLGVVAAARSGAFSVSSNRVEPTGACGGMGWIIGPTGEVLATTCAKSPFVTVDAELEAAGRTRMGYPCSVFAGL